MVPRLFAPRTSQVRPEAVCGIRQVIEGTPVAGIVGALTAMRDRPDSSPLLPTLAGLPTLVVVGAEDVLSTVDSSQRMAAAIPGARLAVVPGAGHLPPVEQPEATARILTEFLAGVS
jgi:pimeloyl-ACP methyl ester carboxylesterase